MPSASAHAIWLAPFTDLDCALRIVGSVQTLAREAGVALREPPPVPTTCCGRGCNGCVWEGFYDAMTWWREDARDAIVTANS